MLFQHILNIKNTNILFFVCINYSKGVFYNTSQFGPATFQVVTSSQWTSNWTAQI